MASQPMPGLLTHRHPEGINVDWFKSPSVSLSLYNNDNKITIDFNDNKITIDFIINKKVLYSNNKLVQY